MQIRNRIQSVDSWGEERGGGLATAATGTIIGVLSTAAPPGAKAAPTVISGEDLTTTAT